MKKVKNLCLLIIISLLSGCESNEQIITECSLIKENNNFKYNLQTEYKIYSEKDIVNKIEINETISSNSSAIISYFENYFTSSYNFNNTIYGGYKNKIVNENDKLKSITTINFNEMNLEKYVEDNSSFKEYFTKDNKLTLEGVKAIYTNLGAICK